MRMSRLVPAAAAAALLVATTSPVQAQTPPAVTGVGTTTGALTLLGLDAGDLLTLDLLTDAGSANIDEATGPRSAAAQISAFALDTAVTDPISVPLLSVASTGEEQTAGQTVALPANPLVAGSGLPLSLGALVDDAGARSTLTAGLTELDVLGGILSLAGSNLDLGSNAAIGDAVGTRGIDVGALTVLDLEALLAALGIPLTDLPLDTLLDLIDGLGLLPQLGAALDSLGVDILDLENLSAAAILDVVDDALLRLDGLDAVVGQLTGAAAPVCDIIDDVVPGLPTIPGLPSLPGLPTTGGTTTCTGTVSEVTTVLAQVRAQITALTDQLRDVLAAPLDLLSGQALLSLDGLDVNVVTKATDDVATSVAEVTGTLGNLQVGELPVLGPLELAAPTGELDGLLAQAEGLIGGILGDIAPSLSDLVQIQSMQELTSVEATEAGGVLSKASFTGLDVQVLPILGELTALLGGLGGLESVGDVLGGLGLPIPASGATDVLAVNSLLAPVTDGLPLLGALAAVEDGLGLQVATLSQQSAFTPFAASAPVAPVAPVTPGAPTAPAAPSQSLPRTGSDDSLLLALAGAAVLAALGGRQLVRRSSSDG